MLALLSVPDHDAALIISVRSFKLTFARLAVPEVAFNAKIPDLHLACLHVEVFFIIQGAREHAAAVIAVSAPEIHDFRVICVLLTFLELVSAHASL